jgi:hypothetical protein
MKFLKTKLRKQSHSQQLQKNKIFSCPGAVAHNCNPCHSGYRDLEDHSLRQTKVKKKTVVRPHLNK